MKKMLALLLAVMMMLNSSLTANVHAEFGEVPKYVSEYYFQVYDENGLHYEKNDKYSKNGKGDVGNSVYAENLDLKEYNLEGIYFPRERELFEGVMQVPYIESNGTQYIDTGVAPSETSTLGINIDFQLVGSLSDQQALFGVKKSDTDGIWFETSGTGANDFAYGAGINNDLTKNTLNITSGRHTINLMPRKEDGKYIMSLDTKENYSVVSSSPINYDFEDKSLYLFASNEADGSVKYGSYRIYSVRIEDISGKTKGLIFTPALIIQDGGLKAENSATGSAIPQYTFGLWEVNECKFYPNVSGSSTDFVCADAPFGVLTEENKYSPLVLKKYYDLNRFEFRLDTDQYGVLSFWEQRYPGEMITIPDVVLPGYVITGWDDVTNGEDNIMDYKTGDQIEMPTSNLWLKPLVESNHYSILCNPNGGSIDDQVITANFNEIVQIPCPTRDGYDFVGWTITGMDNSKHNINDHFSTSTEYTMDEQVYTETISMCRLTSVQGGCVTLTAHWLPANSGVNYNVYAYLEDEEGVIRTLFTNPESRGTIGEACSDKAGNFISFKQDEVVKFLPPEGYNYDKYIYQNKDDHEPSFLQMDYLETHFDPSVIQKANSLLAANVNAKDIQDVQYIDTGLMSQDVYGVDMYMLPGNAGALVKAVSLKGNAVMSAFPIPLFSSLEEKSMTDVSPSASITMINYSAFNNSGLSLMFNQEVSHMLGGEDDAFSLPSSIKQASSIDFVHVVAERDEVHKKVSIGFGDDISQVSYSDSTGIASGLPFILFAAQLKEITIGSNAIYGETIIYGKNHEILRDFVPVVALKDIVIDPSTEEVIKQGTVGMYDKENKKFYASAGNGDFIYTSCVPGAAGKLPGNDIDYKVVYLRNKHSVYTADPLTVDGYEYIDQLEPISQKELLNTINAEGTIKVGNSVCKVLDETVYKYGTEISAPKEPNSKNGYVFVGWDIYGYDSSSDSYKKLFICDPNSPITKFEELLEKAIGSTTMPDCDICFVAHYKKVSEYIPAPKLNIESTSTYTEEKTGLTYPEYEVEMGQNISILCDNPNVSILYLMKNPNMDNEMHGLYTSPIAIDKTILSRLGLSIGGNDVIGLYAFAIPYADLESEDIQKIVTSWGGLPNGVLKELIAKYSYSMFVIKPNIVGDFNPETDAAAADAMDLSFASITNNIWLLSESYNKDPESPYYGYEVTFDPFEKEQRLEGKVCFFTTLLKEGTDYKVTYVNNKNAGMASMKITGKGKYSGTTTIPYHIKQFELPGNGEFIADINNVNFKYNEKAQKPTIKSLVYKYDEHVGDKTVTREIKLKNGVDYTVTYQNLSDGSYTQNPVDTGAYRIAIDICGNYTGFDNIENEEVDPIILPNSDFIIATERQVLVNKLNISGINDVTYTGGPVNFESTIVIKDGKNTIDPMYFDLYYLDKDGRSIPAPIYPGEYTIKIVGKGEPGSINDKYTGIYVKKFKIKGYDISKMKFSKLESSYDYNPLSDVEPIQSIVFETTVDGQKVSRELIKGQHFTVKYENNSRPGTAKVTYTGIDRSGVVGSKTFTYKIKGVALSQFNKADLKAKTYNGLPIVQESNDELLYSDKAGILPVALENSSPNYKVVYSNNTNAGTATITYTGLGLYTGTVKKTFKINPLSIDDDTVSIDTNIPAQKYEKSGAKPDVTLTHKVNRGTKDQPIYVTEKLVLNKDYTLSYKNNTKVGQASVTVKGKGNYTGSYTINFTVEKGDLNSTYIANADKQFTGKANAISPITIYDADGKKLSAGKDYKKDIRYVYANDVLVTDSKTNKAVVRYKGDEVLKTDIVYPRTTIKVIVVGTGNYEGSKSYTYCVDYATLAKAKITVRTQYYTGRGPVVIDKDDISVVFNGIVLPSEAFEIMSYSNNTKAGTGKVTIRGTGHVASLPFGLSGEKTLSFKIVNKPINSVIVKFHNPDPTRVKGSMADYVVSLDPFIADDTYTIKIPTSKFVRNDGTETIGWELSFMGHREEFEVDADIDAETMFEAIDLLNGVINLYPIFEEIK